MRIILGTNIKVIVCLRKRVFADRILRRCSFLILTSEMFGIWVTIFHISKYIAPLINLVISVPINFLINKFWAFKGDKQAESDN